jgi:hypothetical protein
MTPELPVGTVRWIDGNGECPFTEVTCDCPDAEWVMVFDEQGYHFENDCPVDANADDGPAHRVCVATDWTDRGGLFHGRLAEFVSFADEQDRCKAEAAR